MNEKTIITGKTGKISKVIGICVIALGSIMLLTELLTASFQNNKMFAYAPAYYEQQTSMGLFLSVIVIIAGFFPLFAPKGSITVTDKRIYGKMPFGKTFYFPLDSIAKVRQKALNTILIDSSTGKVKMSNIENCDEVYKTICDLLVERQNNKQDNVNTTESSKADEIKKYRELLNGGVITPEEFDAKKKELLGL